MYLSHAKEVLNNEYKTKFALAQTQKQKDFMNEKIKHSYQVLGAGNFILKHEPCFQNCSKKELSLLQATVLLHDIARFDEALKQSQNIHIDHSICGAEILSMLKEFNYPEITLPIKHHGHLIEQLYEDKEYKKLPKEKQNIIKRNAFLVRDADKIANFYLVMNEFDAIKKLFFAENNFKDAHNKNITPSILEDFMSCRSINRSEEQNLADHALMIIAWIYDLNYKTSITFMQRTKIIDRLFTLFSQFWKAKDTQIFKAKICNFIEQKF